MVQMVVISTLEPGVIIGCGILVSSTMETGKYVSSCKVDMVLKANIILSSAIRTNFSLVIGTEVSALERKMVVG